MRTTLKALVLAATAPLALVAAFATPAAAAGTLAIGVNVTGATLVVNGGPNQSCTWRVSTNVTLVNTSSTAQTITDVGASADWNIDGGGNGHVTATFLDQDGLQTGVSIGNGEIRTFSPISVELSIPCNSSYAQLEIWVNDTAGQRSAGDDPFLDAGTAVPFAPIAGGIGLAGVAGIGLVARRRPRVVAALVAAAAMVVGIALIPAAQAPASGGTSVPVQAGAGAQTVGNAFFERVVVNGDETLEVTVDLTEKATSSVLCVGSTAFTSRTPPGQCPYAGTVNGDRVTYAVPLGTVYSGITLHGQLLVQLSGSTAFAGWTNGSPFYGEVPLDSPPPAHLPVAGLGALGLAAVVAAGAGLTVVVRGKRRGSRV
jgi:hypothetical protein